MWASALISKQQAVTEVWAYDLSEQFLTTTGLPMFRRWEGDESKVHLAVGDFNDMPFEPNSFDTAFLLSCVHHSQSPLVTLAR